MMKKNKQEDNDDKYKEEARGEKKEKVWKETYFLSAAGVSILFICANFLVFFAFPMMDSNSL